MCGNVIASLVPDFSSKRDPRIPFRQMSSTVALLGPEAISGFKNDACSYDPRYGLIDCNDNDASTSTGFKIFDKILKKVSDISENHNVLVKLQIASCMIPEIAS